MSKKVAQVLIVGGGPAGLTTAILCRQFGLTVGVVEAAAGPRWAPGEALPDGIQKYFESLGVCDAMMSQAVRYDSNRMRWEGDGTSISFGRNDEGIRQRGIQIPRLHLDRVLWERAVELGVQFLSPCAVRGVFSRDERVAGIVTDKGSFGCDYVVDAAGGRHWLARKLNLPMVYHSPPLFGHFGWAEGDCAARRDEPLIAADPNGWTWTSRVGPHLYQYTRLSFTREQLSSDWLPQEYREAGLRPMGHPRGADLTWRRVARPAGAGYFLAGDALARTDPIVQQGVFKAIACAFKVALTLDRILNDATPEVEAQSDFHTWVQHYILHDLEVLRHYYRRHPHAPASIQDLSGKLHDGIVRPIFAA